MSHKLSTQKKSLYWSVFFPFMCSLAVKANITKTPQKMNIFFSVFDAFVDNINWTLCNFAYRSVEMNKKINSIYKQNHSPQLQCELKNALEDCFFHCTLHSMYLNIMQQQIQLIFNLFHRQNQSHCSQNANSKWKFKFSHVNCTLSVTY